MSETRFTPGPWSSRRTAWDTIQVMIGTPGDQFGICEASAFDQESEANAHLIAAAPDLYEALANLLSFVNRSADAYWKPIYANAIERADAAIAKARGEETKP